MLHSQGSEYWPYYYFSVSISCCISFPRVVCPSLPLSSSQCDTLHLWLLSHSLPPFLSLILPLSLYPSLSLILYLCLSFSQRHVLYSSVLYSSVLYYSLSYSQSLPVEFTIPLCNSPPKRFWYPPIFLLNLLSQRPPVRPPALLICVYEQQVLHLYVSAVYFISYIFCSMKYYYFKFNFLWLSNCTKFGFNKLKSSKWRVAEQMT